MLWTLFVACSRPPVVHAEPPVVDALPPEVVRAEVEQVRAALEVHYPRVLEAKTAWDSDRERLIGIADEPPTDPQSFCTVLGSRLAHFPGVFAWSPGGAAPCGSSEVPGVGPLPERASPIGPNLATDADRLYAYDTQTPDIPVLAVRRFEVSDHAGWDGIDDVLADAVAAPSLVLDLRGAGGHDATVLWPFVERLVGLSPLQPLREVIPPRPDAAPLHDAHEQRFGESGRDVAQWSALVGPSLAPKSSPKTRPARQIVVLAGPGCGVACQLVARTLETFSRATVFGPIDSEPMLVAGNPGLLVLPHTGIEVVFPTTAYVLAPSFAVTPHHAARWNLPSHQPTPVPDGLGWAREHLRWRLDLFARSDRRQVEPPPPCASFPAYADRAAMPEPAADRIQPSLPDKPRVILVAIEMRLPEARAYVAGCPDIVLGSGWSNAWGEISYLTVSAEAYPPLTRLAQCDAVHFVQMNPDLPHEPYTVDLE